MTASSRSPIGTCCSAFSRRLSIVSMNRPSALTAAVPSPGTADGVAAASQMLMPIVAACVSTRESDVCPIPRRGLLATRWKLTASCGLPSSVR